MGQILWFSRPTSCGAIEDRTDRTGPTSNKSDALQSHTSLPPLPPSSLSLSFPLTLCYHTLIAVETKDKHGAAGTAAARSRAVQHDQSRLCFSELFEKDKKLARADRCPTRYQTDGLLVGPNLRFFLELSRNECAEK